MVITRSKGGANNLTLDQNTPVRVRYHAEGAANVVFIITSTRDVVSKDDDYGTVGTTTEDGIPRIDLRLKGKLLRLRKDVPSVTPVLVSHRHYENHIEPLFPPESLVEQLLCKITPGCGGNIAPVQAGQDFNMEPSTAKAKIWSAYKATSTADISSSRKQRMKTSRPCNTNSSQTTKTPIDSGGPATAGGTESV